MLLVEAEMFQRLYAIRIRYTPYSLIFISLLVLLFILPVVSFSQEQFLEVKFDHVSIQDTTVFRGLSARFPYPVLSLITVKDQNNRYVHGLADTTRWLSPTDTTEKGELVDHVWKTILEYHQENNNIPLNPNVKQTDSSYMVTEIYDVKEAGVSVVLVMDYSSSMGDTVYKAEDAAKMLIRAMNPADRVALIKFDDDVVLYQDFTSDTTKLMEAVEAEYPVRFGTHVWDAIDAAVMLCRNETNSHRKHVVVYTDGVDEGSQKDYLEVIWHGVSNKVSIYAIGLGKKIDPWRLSMVANGTGGEYKHAPKLSDLSGVYLEIMKELRAYYALAHMSTDPFTNGTRRVIDLTLNHWGIEGRGIGYYDVPDLDPNVTVSKEVKSDLFSIEMGDTLYHALGGDTVSYSLLVTDNGHGTAPDVKVVDFIPDSLRVLDFDRMPELITEDSIRWSIPRIDPGRAVRINYRARVNLRMPNEVNILTNLVKVDCLSDSIATDNEDHADLYAYGIPDLTIKCIPPAVAVSPKYPFTLSAVVKNTGSADVILPFQVGFFIQDVHAQPVDIDSVAVLTANDSVTVYGLYPALESGEYTIKAFVDCNQNINEMSELNNWDSCGVVVHIDSITVRVSDISYSDRVLGVQGEFPEKILTRVHVVDQNNKHILGLADITRWLGIFDINQLGEIVGDVWQEVSEYHQEDTLFPVNPDVRPGLKIAEIIESDFSLVFVGDFSSEVSQWDENLRNGLSKFVDHFTATDWGAVIGVGDAVETMQSFTQDGRLIKEAFNRSFSDTQRPLYDGLMEAISLACSRSERQGVLALTGGEDVGSSHALSDVIDAALEKGVPLYIIGLGIGNDTRSLMTLCEESGGWYLELSEGTNTQYAFESIGHFLRHYYVLSYTTPDTIQGHNWRTVDISVSYSDLRGKDRGHYLSPSGAADLAVTKSAIGASFSVLQEDTLWYVETGDRVQYTIRVRNIGHKNVKDVSIEDVLPANLIPETFERTPELIQGNTIMWGIDSLLLHESVEFSYRCLVDTFLSSEVITLMNRVAIVCTQDTLLHNNRDSSVVYYTPLKGADVTVKKIGVGDSLVVFQGDSTWYSSPGDTVEYHVTVINQGEMNCHNITVEDILPEYVQFVNFSEPSHWVRGDTLRWIVSQLSARGGKKDFTYFCRVDTFMPPWNEPLINDVSVFCSEDSVLSNNATCDTVWVRGLSPPDPQVRVSPLEIFPGDSVRIEVMTPIDIQSWDLTLIFEDNSEITSYADDFILTNSNLEPNSWIVVIPRFGDTWMRTDGEEEIVEVIFETRDLWNVVRTGRAGFTIRSADEFLLDENVFRSSRGIPLEMRFRLNSNRIADIVIYDVSGGFVEKILDAPCRAGWNSTSWDGKDQNGLFVGSGVYIAILHSGDFKKANKFILVR